MFIFIKKLQNMKETIMLYRPSRWTQGSQRNWEDEIILKKKGKHEEQKKLGSCILVLLSPK